MIMPSLAKHYTDLQFIIYNILEAYLMKKFKISQQQMIIILSLFVHCVSVTSMQQQLKNARNYEKQTQIKFKISDANGNVLYPFNESNIQKMQQCGSTAIMTFVNEQILYIQATSPFVVSVSSKSASVKMSGYSQSIKYKENVNTGIILLNRHCQEYFSSLLYNTIFKVNLISQKASTFEDPIFIEVPSYTYCIDMVQILSLQSIFNIAYMIIIAIIISFLPTFPIGSWKTCILALATLAISQVLMNGKVIFMMILCLIIGHNNSLLKPRILLIQQIKSFNMFQRSFTTLLLSYFVINLVQWLAKPMTAFEASTVFVINIYLKNICQCLLIVQIASSIFWIVRFRGFFWWIVISVLFTIKSTSLMSLYSKIFNSSSFGILLPQIFSQSCQYHSILPILMFVPICQFMEHFHMMKFGGFVIIVSLVLFGAFSQTLAIAISFGWVLIWIIFTLIEQGQFAVFTRRWLYPVDLQTIQRR